MIDHLVAFYIKLLTRDPKHKFGSIRLESLP